MSPVWNPVWACCGASLEGPHDENCNAASQTIARLEYEVARLKTRGGIALKIMTDDQRHRFHRRCWELEVGDAPCDLDRNGEPHGF